MGITLRRQRRGMFAGTREKAARLRDRFSNFMLLLVANGLCIAVVALAIIGGPPRWRIDVLWVNKHSDLIHVALIGLAVAASASVLVMLWQKPRGVMLALWLLAIAVAAAFFWDQLVIIVNVLHRWAW